MTSAEKKVKKFSKKKTHFSGDYALNCHGYYLKTFSECEATIRMRQLLERL